MTTSSLRIIVADSHEIVREGIASRIQKICDGDIVGSVADGYSLLKLCRTESPDIIIMDIGLTRPAGKEVLNRLQSAHPSVKVIVLSSDSSVSNAYFVLSRGGVAFMPKQARGDDFANAVTAAQHGYAYLPIDLLREFLQSRRNLSRTGNIFGLSPREIEILEATVSGMSTKVVAETLNISVRTVETHRNSIYRKTSCRDHNEIARLITAS